MSDLNLLSERELEILQLLAEGKSNKDIAQALFISTNTVKVHLRNIFSKLEVSSRTEAVLLLLRGKEISGESASSPEILLEKDEPPQADVAIIEAPKQERIPVNQEEISQVSFFKQENRWGVSRRIWLPFLVVLGLAGFIVTGIALARLFQPDPAPGSIQDVSSTTERWQAKKDLPAPMTGLAAAIYEDRIYVIGGENTDVLTSFYRYEPREDTWETLISKPTAVTDVQAVVAGGKIYVPGGRLASGQPTNILEIYNPHQENWSVGASLPIPLSAYALVAFEGDLYLFGGWNGKEFSNQVLRYDPNQDQWNELTPMTIARGFAGAATVGGKIYILGGYDGTTSLSYNSIYSPELEGTDTSPWAEGTPLPEGRSSMGVANVADDIFLIGGKGTHTDVFSQMKYVTNEDIWDVTTNPLASPWSSMSVVPFGTKLYAFGGMLEGEPTNRNLIYQVIFSISIPIAP